MAKRLRLEEEIDQHDPVMARNDELSGFVLLEKLYSYKPALAEREKIALRPAESEDPDDRPIRPQTGLVSQSDYTKYKIQNTIIKTRSQFRCKIILLKRTLVD